MNSFFLALLISANVAFMVSVVLGQLEIHDGEPIKFDEEKPKHWTTLRNERLIQECRQELNITRRFRTIAVTGNWVPSRRPHSCLLDCYYFKQGKLYQKNNTKFVEYAFVDPPNFDFYQHETNTYLRRMYEAINRCKLFLSHHHIERCNFMYQFRYCVNLKMKSIREEEEVLLTTRLG